jgi:hypothetical protein
MGVLTVGLVASATIRGGPVALAILLTLAAVTVSAGVVLPLLADRRLAKAAGPGEAVYAAYLPAWAARSLDLPVPDSRGKGTVLPGLLIVTAEAVMWRGGGRLRDQDGWTWSCPRGLVDPQLVESWSWFPAAYLIVDVRGQRIAMWVPRRRDLARRLGIDERAEQS